MAAAVAEEKVLDAPAKAAGGGFFKKILIVTVLLLLFTGINIGVLWYFLGSGGGEAHHEEGGHHDEHAALPETPVIGDPSKPGVSDYMEVELDDYSVSNTMAAQGHTIHITFKLIALVSSASKAQFETSAKQDKRNQVKEQVERVIRSASLNDLKDSQLDFIKRRMREDINKILGNSYINKIVIIEYRLMEQ